MKEARSGEETALTAILSEPRNAQLGASIDTSVLPPWRRIASVIEPTRLSNYNLIRAAVNRLLIHQSLLSSLQLGFG